MQIIRRASSVLPESNTAEECIAADVGRHFVGVLGLNRLVLRIPQVNRRALACHLMFT